MRCGGVKGMKLSTWKKENVEKQASTVNKTAIAAGPGLGAGRMISVSASVISVLSVKSVLFH
mgnify:CR=1 FL=1